jgi:plastocyanin
MVRARDKSRWPGWYLVMLLGFSDKLAAEVRVLELNIKDHLFNPATLYVPAGEKIKLLIHNQDATPEEFESFSLNREKVILGQSKGVVFVGPLAPGEHAFVGEYHPDSARGQIVVLPLAQWLQLEQTDVD